MPDDSSREPRGQESLTRIRGYLQRADHALIGLAGAETEDENRLYDAKGLIGLALSEARAALSGEEGEPKCICALPRLNEKGEEVFGNEECPVHFPGEGEQESRGEELSEDDPAYCETCGGPCRDESDDSLPPSPIPKPRCPTCGSGDPAIKEAYSFGPATVSVQPPGCCTDPFHDPEHGSPIPGDTGA